MNLTPWAPLIAATAVLLGVVLTLVFTGRRENEKHRLEREDAYRAEVRDRAATYVEQIGIIQRGVRRGDFDGAADTAPIRELFALQLLCDDPQVHKMTRQLGARTGEMIREGTQRLREGRPPLSLTEGVNHELTMLQHELVRHVMKHYGHTVRG